jgi:hypothetical protein
MRELRQYLGVRLSESQCGDSERHRSRVLMDPAFSRASGDALIAPSRSARRQQVFDDVIPFAGQRLRAFGTAGAAVPVTGVVQIALFPVEIGVNPGARRAVDRLRDLVSGIPIALRVVPEGDERRRSAGGCV